MPDISVEIEHLALADAHIATARSNIARVERSAADRAKSSQAAARLETLKDTLAAFEGHRDVIVKTIEGLRNGSLPDRT